jgi:hypothetical protein
MNQNLLVHTNNVIKCRNEISKFLSRPRSETRGMALIFGDTGNGKTRLIEKMAFENGDLYYRCKETDKPKDFLLALYHRLTLRIHGAEATWKGTKAQLESACLEILSNHPEITIYIDEINLPLSAHEYQILEIIRDFADLSFASFILCGEADTKQRLEKYNRHFFDRCVFFYQFTKNTLADYRKVADEVADIKIQDDLLQYLYNETNGNLRQAAKMIYNFEVVAKRLQVKELSMAQMRGNK